MTTFLDFIINYYDITIAIVLILVITGVLYLSRIAKLPKKNFLFVIGLLFGVIGIQLLNRFISRKSSEEIEALKKELDQIDSDLKILREKADINNQSLNESLTKIENKRTKIKRNVLIANAGNEEEKEKIKQMDEVEVIKLFNEYLVAN